jgi:hypothetical protein
VDALTESRPRKPFAVWALIADLIVLGLGGLYGGILFVLDPSGAAMGVPLSLLDGLPLPDFLLPGLFLLGVMGLAPLALVVAVWRRWPRTWQALMGLGAVLLLWLAGEFVLWGYQAPIQIITSVLCAGLLGFGLLPATRRWLKRPEPA